MEVRAVKNRAVDRATRPFRFAAVRGRWLAFAFAVMGSLFAWVFIADVTRGQVEGELGPALATNTPQSEDERLFQPKVVRIYLQSISTAENLAEALANQEECAANINEATQLDDARAIRALLRELKNVEKCETRLQQLYIDSVKQWCEHVAAPDAGRQAATALTLVEKLEAVLGQHSIVSSIVRGYLGDIAKRECQFRTAVDHWSAALEVLSAELGTEHAVNISLLHRLGIAESYLGQFAESAEHFSTAATLIRAKYGRESTAYVHTILRLAPLRVKCEQWFEAEALYEEALEITRDRYFPEPVLRGHAQLGLGYIYAHYDEHDAAIQSLRSGRQVLESVSYAQEFLAGVVKMEQEILRKQEEAQKSEAAKPSVAGAPDRARRAELSQHRMSAHEKMLKNDIRGALDHQEEICAILGISEGSVRPEFARDHAVTRELRTVVELDVAAQRAYARGYRIVHEELLPEEGNPTSDILQLQASCHRALDAFSEALPGDSVYAQSLYNGVAAFAMEAGDARKAVDNYLRAQEVAAAQYGEDHPILALRSASLGWSYTILGDEIEAEVHLRRATSARKDIKNHEIERLTLFMAFHHILASRGQLAEAEAVCRQGIRLLNGRDSQLANVSIALHSQLAGLLIWFGDLNGAEQELDQALRICRSCNITQSQIVSDVLKAQSEALKKVGRFEEARIASGRAKDMAPQFLDLETTNQ